MINELDSDALEMLRHATTKCESSVYGAIGYNIIDCQRLIRSVTVPPMVWNVWNYITACETYANTDRLHIVTC
eukprot:3439829-Pyramimonas_sp.AAC.1